MKKIKLVDMRIFLPVISLQENYFIQVFFFGSEAFQIFYTAALKMHGCKTLLLKSINVFLNILIN